MFTEEEIQKILAPVSLEIRLQQGPKGLWKRGLIINDIHLLK